jgi:SulP family sulfate permease
LIFFAVLHVPINVPALAVSTHQAVDVNREIIGHGVANFLAGMVGTPQNYLVYSNSVLYIRSGGNSTIGSLMLAAATAIIWVFGSGVIQLIPILVVGGLIFHLSFDLMKESIWDTWHVGISSWEYFTIIMIVFIMAFFGFTEGILAGMVLACFFFVVMYSRRSIIKSTQTGLELRSTVHRPYRQRLFLDNVGEQIKVVRLKGFLFFGTISQLETYMEDLLEKSRMIRFVILEFSLISGVDVSYEFLRA